MSIPVVDSTADAELSARLEAAVNNKTKPLGSLGMLETLARQVGLVQRTVQPRIVAPAILVFAGDHGVVAEKVSPYPQDVTWQMVENFLGGGAAINVFARQNACALRVVDAGVNHDFGVRAGLLDRKVAHGTRNFMREAAMTREQCLLAIRYGVELVDSLEGNVLGFGEMGIGNTSAAAALMRKLTGAPLEDCVGAGAGLSEEGVAHKLAVLRRAVELHAQASEPLDILAALGGFEIAMMAGAMLAAARRRMVLLIDGFIVTSALLVAARLRPAVLDYCVFSHCSDERGHTGMLAHLGARPLLQLGLRLGEGSGCALALPLLHAAVNFLNDMATFESAQVSGKDG
ncbi:nicotinate-nucleotide--dimethylbenzimidazole phosphoribosyltransferase [Noviherbaspirillum sp. CPCC 100848]|uniref:Nicotinate-nucleotide--dimethylbenzimidazole phosphoribosyltransferase n=1 Tax=Noviherbaspirillum album TaxID=3080276 RepID=A0ABU6JET4_9BURK|nr:nicotinate-nucleotide--dimethylbenzimidazole phosphoribosyltransferase [Noviherbaspirillum sp. CPCC 100848]MEC4722186.1 nicotinate-nucleotide--dimethylbenzimidazole phosphoribosyltransferase [Noviherbaspirillum sp. CPCC 100848]